CRVSLVVPILICAAGFLIAPIALQVAEKLRARPERILVVGASSLAERIVREAGNSAGVVVGYVGDGAFPSPDGSGSIFLGPTARLSEIVNEQRPDRIIVALTERRGGTPIEALLESCLVRGIVVEDAAQ